MVAHPRAPPTRAESLSHPRPRGACRSVTKTHVQSKKEDRMRLHRTLKTTLPATIAVALVLGFVRPALVNGGPPLKVDVCHIPPDNPNNFHTSTIPETALPAHLDHGDLAGSCGDNCETMCDDGDSCTIDTCEAGP